MHCILDLSLADDSTMPLVQAASEGVETQSSYEALSHTSRQVEKTRGPSVSKAIADDIMLLDLDFLTCTTTTIANRKAAKISQKKRRPGRRS